MDKFVISDIAYRYMNGKVKYISKDCILEYGIKNVSTLLDYLENEIKVHSRKTSVEVILEDSILDLGTQILYLKTSDYNPICIVHEYIKDNESKISTDFFS